MTITTKLRLHDGNLLVQTHQDVEAIIECNKSLRSDPRKSDWGRHIASIPNNILLAWLQEEWSRGNINLKLFDADFNRLIAKKLNDPDWRFLRTD
jgi:hypothetical protein